MVMPSGTKVATEGWWMDSYSALAIGFGAISRIQQMELRKRTIFQDIRPYELWGYSRYFFFSKILGMRSCWEIFFVRGEITWWFTPAGERQVGATLHWMNWGKRSHFLCEFCIFQWVALRKKLKDTRFF